MNINFIDRRPAPVVDHHSMRVAMAAKYRDQTQVGLYMLHEEDALDVIRNALKTRFGLSKIDTDQIIHMIKNKT